MLFTMHSIFVAFRVFWFVMCVSNRVVIWGRWTDLIPMSPMEGCPDVYQVVVSLVPGLHQVC